MPISLPVGNKILAFSSLCLGFYNQWPTKTPLDQGKNATGVYTGLISV